MSVLMDIIRGESTISFSYWWKRMLVVSAVAVIASVVALSVKGLNLNVEFTGGISMEVAAPGVSVQEAREELSEIGQGGAKVQIVGTDTLRVQVGEDQAGAEGEIRQTMAEIAGTPVEDVSVSNVSGTWGADVTRQALRALVVFVVLIMLYLSVRLEWKMAVAAIVGVVHDVIITVGIYSIFGLEVSSGTVIAFLTILGVSIYDTVVVFDKVRETEGRARTGGETYTEVVSDAMNVVLLRSLNTTIASLLPVISLLVVGTWIMGAVTLGQFAVAIGVGLAVGAYSSIYVSAPLLAIMKEREPHYMAVRAKSEELSGNRSVVSGAIAEPAEPAAASTAAAAKRPGTGRSGARVPTGTIPPRPRKNTPKKRG